ncbi:MAG: hypothetical protein LBK83_09700 [Treponema sp.]|nr:hypothetical protein [Treponema sp.]
MKKSKLFLAGMAALLLTFGLVLAGCPTDGGGGGSSFDGTTLAGTNWVATKNVPYPFGGDGLSMDTEARLEFSSNTAGTATRTVTKWNGDWPEEFKSKMEGMMKADNGAFTSTYDAAAKTGTYTLKSGTPGTFTADVGKQTLTAIEVDDGEAETTVYKLD